MAAARRVVDLASRTRSPGGADRPPSFVGSSGTNSIGLDGMSPGGGLDVQELERDRVAWLPDLPPGRVGFPKDASR